MSDRLDVLLIEDNPGDARLLEELLKEAKRRWEGDPQAPDEVELHHATDLDAGHELFADHPIDVVLLDLGLPDSTGIDTLDRLDVEGIPVLVLTGFPESELGTEAMRHGAQDYLVKGDVSAESVARAIQYALERMRTEQALQDRTDQLETLNQLMRHDVRNDVSLVVGRAQELSEYVDPRGEDILGEIVSSSNHVLQLTRTMGDAIEAVTGDGVERKSVDLSAILENEIDNARRLYGEPSIGVEGELPDVPVRAGRLLSAVVGNLLSNAMLHSPGDTPEVRVSVDVHEDTVTIRVADNGRGVPDHRKEAIFGRGESDPDSQGLGVGLYLVDQLVGQYEGDIWVEDNEPTGAVFCVRLDRA